MSYTCPDCTDGVLVAKVREIEVADDETAEIVDGRVRIASVRCNNGCSPETEDEEEKPKRKKRKKHRAAAAVDEESDGRCLRSDSCSKSRGHMGRCDQKREAAE